MSTEHRYDLDEDVKKTVYQLIVSQLWFDNYDAIASEIEVCCNLFNIHPSNQLYQIIRYYQISAEFHQTVSYACNLNAKRPLIKALRRPKGDGYLNSDESITIRPVPLSAEIVTPHTSQQNGHNSFLSAQIKRRRHYIDEQKNVNIEPCSSIEDVEENLRLDNIQHSEKLIISNPHNQNVHNDVTEPCHMPNNDATTMHHIDTATSIDSDHSKNIPDYVEFLPSLDNDNCSLVSESSTNSSTGSTNSSTGSSTTSSELSTKTCPKLILKTHSEPSTKTSSHPVAKPPSHPSNKKLLYLTERQKKCIIGVLSKPVIYAQLSMTVSDFITNSKTYSSEDILTALYGSTYEQKLTFGTDVANNKTCTVKKEILPSKIKTEPLLSQTAKPIPKSQTAKPVCNSQTAESGGKCVSSYTATKEVSPMCSPTTTSSEINTSSSSANKKLMIKLTKKQKNDICDILRHGKVVYLYDLPWLSRNVMLNSSSYEGGQILVSLENSLEDVCKLILLRLGINGNIIVSLKRHNDVPEQKMKTNIARFTDAEKKEIKTLLARRTIYFSNILQIVKELNISGTGSCTTGQLVLGVFGSTVMQDITLGLDNIGKVTFAVINNHPIPITAPTISPPQLPTKTSSTPILKTASEPSNKSSSHPVAKPPSQPSNKKLLCLTERQKQCIIGVLSKPVIYTQLYISVRGFIINANRYSPEEILLALYGPSYEQELTFGTDAANNRTCTVKKERLPSKIKTEPRPSSKLLLSQTAKPVCKSQTAESGRTCVSSSTVVDHPTLASTAVHLPYLDITLNQVSKAIKPGNLSYVKSSSLISELKDSLNEISSTDTTTTELHSLAFQIAGTASQPTPKATTRLKRKVFKNSCTLI